MSTQTETGSTTGTGKLAPWQAAVVGSVVGTVAFGAMMMTIIPDPVLDVAIPNLVGVEARPNDTALAVGWVVHLAIGVGMGLAYAGAMQVDAIGGFVTGNGRAVVAGLGYGVVTWIAGGVVLMPVLLSTMGFPAAPDLPNIKPLGFVGHLVFGVLLAVVYQALAAR
ncbi:histidine kinase [Halobacteriales archaeon QS_1_68_20]|nr:MAG: histidine kinase [Halobacteriales archaeon QS_1_68_20]